ncbi:transposase [Paenibacillus sp. 1-18]|uniref:transposase n=1 Tax=Paenibacillus sp. 1-18 TaxID=1333846 RepID=UPI0004B0F5C3|nr:transposase [Paenibacillus sp. 1-18]
MEAELDAHLGYAKHDTKNKKTSNSRNGKSAAKTVSTELGDIQLRTPNEPVRFVEQLRSYLI